MPIPEAQPKYYELNVVDRTIANIVDKLDSEISPSELNRVSVAASVQSGIEKYRSDATDMSLLALSTEEHKSERLGLHLVEKFGARPARCHAHAIVAGKHQYAAQLRLIMAALKIRIDDVDNGCWLPENSAATPHPAMPAAPPHSRIHRYNYYFWLRSRLGSLTKADMFRTGLKIIAKSLYTGKMPDYVMLKKGAGLPRGRG